MSIQGYEFRPTSGMTTMPDADYLAWGVWLTVPDAVPVMATMPTWPLQARSRAATTRSRCRAALKGKATYNGVASGLYSAGGMVENFDADVMLEANFGGIVGG